MLDLFQYSFMQRALLAGVILAGLLSYLGVFVVLRRMTFFSDGMAHASLAGVAAGLLFNVNPLVVAILASIVFAVGVFFVEKRTNLSSDAVIGLLFTASMAFGVLLMSFRKGYQPELVGFLFGDILTIRKTDLILIAAVGFLIGFLLVIHSRKITLLALDREMAYLSGLHTDFFELTMYVVLAVSVVLGIKILGVVLVSALLVIPVSIAKLISRSFRSLVFWSLLLSEVIVLVGLVLSSWFDLPTGAVIVLTGALFFFVVFIFRSVRS